MTRLNATLIYTIFLVSFLSSHKGDSLSAAAAADNAHSFDRQIIVEKAEEKIFPLILFDVQSKYFPIVKEAGFNMVHLYSSKQDVNQAKEYLRLAKINKLSVMQNMPSAHLNSGDSFWIKWVNELKEHRNLKWWYLPEEEMAHKIKSIARIVKNNDSHKRACVTYLPWDSPETLAKFEGVLDYLMLGSYPEYYGEPRANMKSWIEAGINSPVSATIGVLPAFDTKKGRPGVHDIRCDAYTAIISGAKGLAWYSYARARLRSGLWKGLKQVAYEIAGANNPDRLERVITSPDVRQTIRIKRISGPAGTPKTYKKIYGSIQYLQKEYKGNIYIFAVNLAQVYPGRADYKNAAVTVRFSALSLGVENVEVLFEDRAIKVSNGSFIDIFNELDVHIYRLTRIIRNRHNPGPG